EKGENPLQISMDRATELIKEKEAADAPIYEYDNLPVQKGVGRFGPYLKWNNMFINVNKKYDFDDLSAEDIEQLLEDKLKKEREKLIHNWEDEGIRVEKARWGRFNIIKGKIKVELPKTVDAEKLTLEEVKAILEKKAPKKKAAKKKPAAKKKSTRKTVAKKK
ncbi:MAG TPA: topoisomerase C-terminal repeat-containing protein, partial [Aequorivita sp.]|nr:topoisomerase C-terminal repeat-containing protein [Aequorivita sp.]